jgi:RNase H-fold protein (predicted Holliday junction resolvase)
MSKYISIDPGKYKCGLVLAEISEKKVHRAIVLKSELIEDYIRDFSTNEEISNIIIGNGTTSRKITEKLDFFKKKIIIFEEKNTTYRAKARYFELFPISGLQCLIPREIFIVNKNLDAISALVILEDFCKMKFTFNQNIKNIDFKTWLK